MIDIASLSVDEYGTITVKEAGDDTVQVMPMIFNDRITLGRTDNLDTGYDYGWCYDKGPGALLAALAWDPLTEPEPAGFKKRVNTRPRELS